MRRFWVSLLVVVMTAAACGDDSTDGADDTSSDSVEVDDAESGDGADGSDESSGDDGDGESSGDDGDAGDDDGIVLSDSYRGVTSETVTIGIAGIDLGEVNETFGLDFTVTPAEEMYRAWTDVLNANGGINGRDVILEYTAFFPVGGEDADRVCLELMADKEVFVVIGQFLQDAMLCITQTYGHPYVGHFGETPERQEKSDGLFFALEIAQDDQRVGGVRAMIEAGEFDGKAVAVVWESDADAVYSEAVLPVLADAGVNVVETVEVDAFTTDTVNNQNAWDLTMERIDTAGADLILNLSGITGVLDAAQRTGATQTVAHTNGQAADGLTVLENSIAEDEVLLNSFAITTWKPDIEQALADDEVQRCIAEFTAAYPDIEVDLESSDWVNGFTNNCRAFAMTVKILETARGDLTPETFREAGESLGTFDLPAMAGATLGPDKHSAGSTLSRYEYDPATEQYVKVGDPIPAG